MTTKLDVINSMISTTGVAKLASSDYNHPEYRRAEGVLDDVLEEFCGMPMWFNVSDVVLKRAEDGTITVPSDALNVDPVFGTGDTRNVVVRGRKLWDMDAWSDQMSSDIKCRILWNVELTDMPAVAYQFVRAAARLQYFIDVDGDQVKLQMYGQVFQQKRIELDTKILSNRDENFFASRSAQSFFTRRYPSGPAGNYNGIGGYLPVR